MKYLLRDVLLYVHLIGFALLLGGALAQYLTGRLRINAAMLWGVVVQLVTGIALAAPLPRHGAQPDHVKVAVKAVLAILIAIMAWVPRKRETVNRGHYIGIVAMTAITAGVAVFWH